MKKYYFDTTQNLTKRSTRHACGARVSANVGHQGETHEGNKDSRRTTGVCAASLLVRRELLCSGVSI